MKKKSLLLVALIVVFSMLLAACGDSETEKNTAKATMTEGEMPMEDRRQGTVHDVV